MIVLSNHRPPACSLLKEETTAVHWQRCLRVDVTSPACLAGSACDFLTPCPRKNQLVLHLRFLLRLHANCPPHRLPPQCFLQATCHDVRAGQKTWNGKSWFEGWRASSCWVFVTATEVREKSNKARQSEHGECRWGEEKMTASQSCSISSDWKKIT